MNETEKNPSRLKEFISRWKFLFIIIACVVAVYVQSLSFDFVNYDDVDLIVENQDFLSKPENILNSFTNHVFVGKRAESIYYRPILQDSYILDYQIWKLNPLGYHLTNLLLHLVTSILVFYLLRKLLAEQWIALFGSVLFALHPAQTEAVAWIAGRNDVLLGLFTMMMLLSYVHYREQTEKRLPFYLLSIVSFALAIFTKEPAAFYLLLLPIYDRCFKAQKTKDLYAPSYLSRILPFILVFAGYMVIRLNLFGEMIGAEKMYGTPFIERLLQAPSMIIEHISVLIVPVKLCVVHPIDTVFWFTSPWTILSSVLLLLYIIAVFLSWRYDRLLTFGLLWLFIGLLPVTNIIPVAIPILEHRLYVPIVAFVLILARLIVLFRSSKVSALILPVVIIIILISASMSFFRLPAWQNSETMWKDAIEKSPTDPRPYFNLSGYYFDLRQYDKVIPVLETYVRLEPFHTMAYLKLRQTYFFAGRYNDAARVCKTLIAFNPTNPQRYIETGILYERLNQPDSAYAIYKQGLVADSNSFELHYKIAVACERMGNYPEADYHYNKTLVLNHTDPLVLYSAGRFYANTGNIEKAISIFEKAITLAKPPQEALILLHNLYIKTKHEEKYFDLLRRIGMSR